MPATFDYLAPATIPEAVAAVGAGGVPLAGGQGLLPAIRTGRAEPSRLVDLGRIGALDRIEERNGEGVRIGALTTLDTLLEHPALDRRHAALVEAARASGDPQLRNRATVGGCLADATTAADLAAPLLALAATVTLVGAAGERTFPIVELYRREVPVADGEIITRVDVPRAPPGQASGYEKVGDRATNEPICAVAVTAVRGPDDGLEAFRVAVTGATILPTRLLDVERVLGNAPDRVDIMDLPVGQPAGFRDDRQASAEYRMHLTRVLTARALTRVVAANQQQ